MERCMVLPAFPLLHRHAAVGAAASYVAGYVPLHACLGALQRFATNTLVMHGVQGRAQWLFAKSNCYQYALVRPPEAANRFHVRSSGSQAA